MINNQMIQPNKRLDLLSEIEQINKPDPVIKAQRSQQINQLFESWNQLDEEEEQQETLKIIELAEGVSISYDVLKTFF